MRVAKKGDRAGRFEKAAHRLQRRKNVFIFVMKRAVNHRQAICGDGSTGQLRNISGVVGLEVIAGPSRRNLRDRIEIVQIRKSRHSLIVISPDDNWLKGLHALGHFVRIRTVVDDISETKDSLPAAFGGRERGVKRCKIRVNIAQYEKSHRSRSVARRTSV